MQKLKFIVSSFTISLLLIISTANAANDEKMENEKDIKTIVTEIIKEQNVASQDKIVCKNVTEKQFEELGDAVMEVIHPQEGEHEAVETMMGGEGSVTLKYTHIQMGEQYLGCGSRSGTIGMMGYNNFYNGKGMMGRAFNGSYPYMMNGWNGFGNSYLGLFGIALMHAVFGLAFVVVATLAVKAIWNSDKNNKK